MMQALHIFRKDVRHLWPEIGLNIALLIAFAWMTSTGWNRVGDNQFFLQTAVLLLHALLPMLWVVVISRLVHDEPLVGDRQFWLSRPYTWGSLLLSKVLFIAAFLMVPFVAMQSFLLMMAGLHPLASVAGLMLNVLYWVLICFLPLTLLAALTSTYPRLALWAIIAILYVFAIGSVASSTFGIRMMHPLVAVAIAVLLGVCMGGILLFQYATRRTTEARVALFVTPLLVAVLFLIVPTDALFRHSYPVDDASGMYLSFDPSAPQQRLGRGRMNVFEKNVIVNLPAKLDGVGASTAANIHGASYTIEGPGVRYTSPWQNAAFSEGALSLTVPQRILERAHGQRVHLTVLVAADRMVNGGPESVVVTDRFRVPDGGACVFTGELFGPLCRYAMHGPPATEISGPVQAQPCFEGRTAAPDSTYTGYATLRSFPHIPTLDPVDQEAIFLRERLDQPLQRPRIFTCAGSTLQFITWREAGKMRFEIDVPAIVLDGYATYR